mmetsp:Transcript_34773/g.75820  ORF Transcript_34773/g.75820 Transcript_34773/m.75820 type:complete len:225 (-) Transcript_34773:222-896(-)
MKTKRIPRRVLGERGTSRVVPCTMANGLEIDDTASACSFGLTAPATRVSGEKIALKGKVASHILVVTLIPASGWPIRLMAVARTGDRTLAPPMWASGSRTRRRGGASRRGSAGAALRAPSKRVRRMGVACTCGLTAPSTSARGRTMLSVASVSTQGAMVVGIRGCGRNPSYMASAATTGQMVGNIAASTSAIGKMALASSRGPMDGHTRAFGTRDCSMAAERPR